MKKLHRLNNIVYGLVSLQVHRKLLNGLSEDSCKVHGNYKILAGKRKKIVTKTFEQSYGYKVKGF